MTINVNTSRNEYTATSGQTVFNFTFKIYTATDLNVYVTPAGQECNDVTDLTEAYTVTGVGLEDGGSITLNTGAGANDLVTIVSAIPSSRTTDYQSNGDFTPETVNNDIDRAISLIKQVESKADRSLLSSECLQGPKPLTLPKPEPGDFMRWKTDLSGLENVPGSAIAEGVIVETDYVKVLDTVAEMVADTSLVVGQTVRTQGYNSAGDGGDAVFLITAGEPASNNVTVIALDNGNYAVMQSGNIISDYTVTIPTYYSTLQAALDHLGTLTHRAGAIGTIQIETGHALTAGFRIENGDWSHLKLTSVDAEVGIAAGFAHVSNQDLESDIPRTPLVGFLMVNATAPEWNILVDMTGVATTTGLEYSYTSKGVVRAGAGVKNTANGVSGVNLRVTSTSNVQAAQSIFTGAAGDCVAITTNSQCNLQDADCSGAVNNACLDVSRGSIVHCKDANLSNGGTEGMYVRRSFVSAQGVNVGGATVGIWSAVGSFVGAQGADFTGCTNDGKIEDGSTIVLSGATKSAVALDPADSINIVAFNTTNGNGTIYASEAAPGNAEFLTKESALTTVVGDRVNVASLTYHTILDETGADTVYGGVIMSQDLGIRITIDGVVVLTDVNRAPGLDGGSNQFSSIPIPPCKSTSSLKIEAFNRSSSAENVSWKIYRR